MVSLSALWLPILVATVLAFLAGAVLYMLTPVHKGEWSKLPNEDALLEQIRKAAVPPGLYLFPCPTDLKDMNSPAMLQKMEAGPIGNLIIRTPGKPNMGPMLAGMAMYHLIVSFFVAYIATRTLPAGTSYLRVFQVVGTTGILAYAAGGFPFANWYLRSWDFLGRHMVDGVVWGLLTAGAFAWLWPR